MSATVILGGGQMSGEQNVLHCPSTVFITRGRQTADVFRAGNVLRSDRSENEFSAKNSYV